MKKALIIVAAALALASCAPKEQNPFMQEWDTPYGIPPFDKIKIEHYMPAIKAGIAQHEAEVQAIVDNPAAPTFENTVAALELSGSLLT
ncbi:MAG: peptidase M3, partial [Bacteroidales bacterium]|nr:peptidase M3 [Bacteroidales bacterium]